MDFEIPADIQETLDQLDTFIERERLSGPMVLG